MRPPIDAGVVLLTGASSGIGEAMARLLAPRCAVLVLVARRTERLELLAGSLRALAPALVVEVSPCDLGQPQAVAQLAAGVQARHGRVDVLINNAGMGDIGLFEVAAPDKLLAMLQVNVIGLTVLTRALLPGMVARGRGGVLNISSGFGLSWIPGAAAYAGSKHYVTAMSEALRCELSGTGVVLTQVCPGPVATEFEAIAGNPTGQQVPGFLELSADACARQGLAAFDAGRAMVVPGFWAWLLVSMGRLSPAWVLRPLYGLLGRLARRRLPAVRRTGT